MKLLSIDFDYFQNTTEELLRHYPDGIDNNTNLSEVVWGSHYSTNSKLETIEIRKEELVKLENVLYYQNADCPVMIANSHKHIYDYIKSLDIKDKLEIINVDMHHDIVNGNTELDCGNWLSHVINEREEKGMKTILKWITHPLSIKTYGLESCLGEAGDYNQLVEANLDFIKNMEFDGIFLCRSDTWTPPHLDIYFTCLCNILKNRYWNVRMEKGIDIPRSRYKEIKETLKNLRK